MEDHDSDVEMPGEGDTVEILGIKFIIWRNQMNLLNVKIASCPPEVEESITAQLNEIRQRSDLQIYSKCRICGKTIDTPAILFAYLTEEQISCCLYSEGHTIRQRPATFELDIISQ